jgi:hypothetical protein
MCSAVRIFSQLNFFTLYRYDTISRYCKSEVLVNITGTCPIRRATILNTVQIKRLAMVGLVLLLDKEAGMMVYAHQHCEDEEEGHHHTAHQEAPAAQASTTTPCTVTEHCKNTVHMLSARRESRRCIGTKTGTDIFK